MFRVSRSDAYWSDHGREQDRNELEEEEQYFGAGIRKIELNQDSKGGPMSRE